MTTLHQEFWQRHAGLIWSNPDADDSVRIRAALMRPRFSLLLSIAVEFDLDRLRTEWAELVQDPLLNTARVRGPVERILANIQKGFERAAI